MRASGNGNVQRCAENLLATVRGEVPYDRLKGLDTRAIDKPAEEVQALIQQDAEWMLEIYEPRGKVRDIILSPGETDGGQFHLTAVLEE